MTIDLESKQLINTQQMEVAVNGPDGATHLILCSGVADLGCAQAQTYTFLVGPQLAPRQFVGVNASGAFAGMQFQGPPSAKDLAETDNESNFILVQAAFDKGAHQVRVNIEVCASAKVKLAVAYQVSILAELPHY